MTIHERLSALDTATTERIARHVKALNLYIFDFMDYGNNIVRFYTRVNREQNEISMFIGAILDLAEIKDYQIYFVGSDKMHVSFANKEDSEFALSILRRNI